MLDRHNNIRAVHFALSGEFGSNQRSPSYIAPELIKGQKYTQAADIWSLGILLYSMVVGQLPYSDDNTQRLIQKVLYTDVIYPDGVSPALIDLLRKILSKNPDSRITLDKIKEHHWFSPSEYSALIENAVQWPTSLDKEVVEKMAPFGIDCRQLHHQWLKGESTELTSIYRQMVRANMTDKMKDLLSNLDNVMQRRSSQMTMKFEFQPLGARNSSQKLLLGAPGQRFRPPGSRAVPVPLPKAPGGIPTPASAPTVPRLMQAPAPVQIAARRLSQSRAGVAKKPDQAYSPKTAIPETA
jgi:serine/threonine protein kinase